MTGFIIPSFAHPKQVLYLNAHMSRSCIGVFSVAYGDYEGPGIAIRKCLSRDSLA